MPETPRTIGIIEDDESVRRALRRLFLSMGFDVQAFVTAEEFLESLTQPLPSCLVLDVNLPGLSGLELQHRLCAEGRHVPIVIITAYASDKAREQALEAGAIAFLAKPFEEASLLQAVFGVVT
jgi:FixJ family two-component response regulator